MNENQVENLLSRHSAEILRRRIRPTKRHIAWKPVLVTGTAVLAVGAFLALPKKAEAAPFEKITSAFKQTPYWMATTSGRSPGGPWKLSYSSCFFEGKMRGVSVFMGGPPRQVISIIDSGFAYDDFSDLPYILKTPFAMATQPYLEGMTDPLKNSLLKVARVQSKLIREDGLKYQGRDVYSLKLLNEAKRNTFEALIERDTNLPQIVTLRLEGKDHKFDYETKTEYSYQKPVDMQPLSPNLKKKIVDVEAEKKSYGDQWSQVPTQEEAPTIYGSSISPDGTIWVTFGVKNHEKNGWTPLRIVDKNYTQSSSFLMSSSGSSRNFRANGNEVITANFVPIDEAKPHPAQVQIEFGNKPPFLSEPTGMAKARISCTLSRETQNFPAHFPAFMLEVPISFLASNQLNVRAHAKEARGDTLGAAQAYEAEYRILLAQTYNAKDRVLAAIRCYEKVGNTVKVKELKTLLKAKR